MTERAQRLEILAGVAGFAALGAVAVGGAARNLTRQRVGRLDPNSIENFGAIYDDRASIVVADDGVPLAVREVGPPTAPLTVVFVHGFALRMSSWHFQRQALAEVWGDSVRLVFFDHRGHGESGDAPADTCDFPQLAADIDAVLRAVVPDGPVVLVGHSMGGMALMALARRSPELFAHRVIAVGLIATAARGIAETGLGKGLQNPVVDAFRVSVRWVPWVVEAGRGVSRQLVAPVLSAASFGSEFRSPSLGQFVESMIQHTPIETVVNFLRALEDHDESAALPVLATVPTMVACGFQDRVTPLANTVEMHAALGDCDLVGVPDSGHLVLLEHPDEINLAIMRLVAGASRSGRGR
ncbi:alpha/beta fold hydrolase [Williamsia sterculiae]|uniref:Pimeloyl-ACP methyl ester carboxylesterase n=1 Tax=Williamsia sterculiae TaxID=1344003 RepID=A0A1N7DUT6_9NOCA|nr:alpha/beta hydrolase [Williamsia sterculiae]SIR79465.1 Pimeloyl-ACP methyl ester carboxylesterase [Williamsia sterculiae]